MTQDELNKIIELHRKWLWSEPNGEYADLSHTDLSYADLRGAKLGCANLSGAKLNNANLSGTNLSNANLSGAKLNNANLSGAELGYSNLSGAKLGYANLRGAKLGCANLSGAKLGCADLSYADLRGAKLSGASLNSVRYNEETIFFALQCPEEGSFIGYKKCRGKIIKLLITEDAKRASATSRKCRCSKAKVLEIEGGLKDISSDYNSDFIYRVGEIVEVKDFDEDRWNEGSTGIHFFITRKEAEQY